MKHLILLNSLPCYKCTDARTDSVNLGQDWLKCLHCNDSLYKPTQLIYKHTLTTDISGNMFHVKHPFPFDLKTSLQICGQSQVFQIIRYDWIKCFHCSTILRTNWLSLFTNSRDHQYRQHVSCEASISIWQENINTNMQAIAAILDTSDRAWAS